MSVLQWGETDQHHSLLAQADTADANSHSDRGVVDTKQTVCW